MNSEKRGQRNMNIIKSISEFFSSVSSEPVGLCSFENVKDVKKNIIVKPKRKKEMRLSELME